MRIIYLIIVGLYLPLFSFSQSDFREGYIINNENDTIFGKIDYRSSKKMGMKCRFKANDGVIKYYPGEISSFRFTEGKMFISKEIQDSMVFLQYLVNGVVDIYYFEDRDGDHYYIGKEGKEILELPYGKKVKRVNGKNYFFESSTHKAVLVTYMDDAPILKSKIAKFKRPDHDNLIKLAEEYHDIVCDNNSKCVVYSKNPYGFKLDFELIGGAVFFKEYVRFNPGKVKKFSNIYGIVTNFWLPRVNERIYLRMGLMRISSDYNSTLKYRVPIQLQYLYPKGKIIRPKFAYGVYWYPTAGNTVDFSTGANITLHKKIDLSLTYDIEFTSSFIGLVPSKFLSQFIYLGMYVDLVVK